MFSIPPWTSSVGETGTSPQRTLDSVGSPQVKPKYTWPIVTWLDNALQDGDAEINNALNDKNTILQEQNAQLCKQLSLWYNEAVNLSRNRKQPGEQILHP